MFHLFTAILLFISTAVFAQKGKSIIEKITSPLAGYSAEWNKPQYLVCNTAKNAMYMGAKERTVIYILNLMRTNPKFFAQNVLAQYPDKSEREELVNIIYYKTLMDTLLKMQPLNMVNPDKQCYTSALCHALSSGIIGDVTHERENTECERKKYFDGECIDYGSNDPLDIVLNLLIDEDVPSLGHRFICISSYKLLGVSIKPHKSYGNMTVLDFHY